MYIVYTRVVAIVVFAIVTHASVCCWVKICRRSVQDDRQPHEVERVRGEAGTVQEGARGNGAALQHGRDREVSSHVFLTTSSNTRTHQSRVKDSIFRFQHVLAPLTRTPWCCRSSRYLRTVQKQRSIDELEEKNLQADRAQYLQCAVQV